MFIIITLYFFYEKGSAYLLSRLLAQNSSKQMRVNKKQHYRVLGTFAAKLFRKLSKCSLLTTNIINISININNLLIQGVEAEFTLQHPLN